MKTTMVWLALLASAVTLTAQTPGPVTFEAASIKRNVSGDARVRFETPPGRLNATNVPLRFLVRQAYRVPEARIIGGPSWLDVDRFDVVANLPAGVSGDAMRDALKALLKERFGLVMHNETREMPIYELHLSRGDGGLGPNLRRSTTDCTGTATSVVAGQVRCGILVSQGPGSGSIRGGAATIENFARLLGDFLDRPLNDRTGLTGTYDLELQFTAARSATPGAPVPGGLSAASSPDEIPAVFTAIQEQMGLKLNAVRGRADVWVVDAVSVPTVE